MRRFAIFGLIGPFVGFLVFIALGGGFASHAVEAFLILLPFAMIAGLVPAILTALFDSAFEKWPLRRSGRFMGVAAIGYATAYLLMLENLVETTVSIPFEYRWGLIGAIPAVFCSWLNELATR
ncbi:hypothetical protein [Bradyrhizobium sp. CCBAU 51753]|uniref:hypothetical protein n=1 Tax=Bradyrhizobium sp. CCBAU 51753 TaxID=1325100 RepID=UPI00188CB74A|nr:hypothetical protein [Bradyrhizobium sp. CCBAU 51753]